jgi:hypothetical protein
MREFRSAAFGRCQIPRNHEQASGVVFLHGLARGAPDRTVRYPDRRDARDRHHLVGSDDRGSAAVDPGLQPVRLAAAGEEHLPARRLRRPEHDNDGTRRQVESSRAWWDGRTLIIVTTFLVSDRAVGKPFTTELTRRLYLESATTRSIYRKG